MKIFTNYKDDDYVICVVDHRGFIEDLKAYSLVQWPITNRTLILGSSKTPEEATHFAKAMSYQGIFLAVYRYRNNALSFVSAWNDGHRIEEGKATL